VSHVRRLALLVFLTSPPATLAQETTLLWNDVRAPAERATDLVFLSDGFRADEREAFEASARRSIELLEQQTASFVRSDRDAWNLYVAFVPSLERCPASHGQPARRTAFETRLAPSERGGLFESDDRAISDAARAVCPGVDCTIVIVRADRAIRFATGDLPGEGSRIRLPVGLEGLLLHELGHSLFGLGDEYGGVDAALPEHERTVVPFYPNVTLDPGGARFEVLAGDPVEVEEGALGFERGVFRPRGPCVMRDSSAGRFCLVCAPVIAAGRPPGPPVEAPALDVSAVADVERGFRARIEAGHPAANVVRCFAVLVPSAELDSRSAAALFTAAQARVSNKTRYMESDWLGDGTEPGQRVFSLEGNVGSFAIDGLEPGAYTLIAASANVLGCSPIALARFEVR